MVTIDEGSAFAEEVLSVCRTVVGDELRSITAFTDRDVAQIYLRSDLDQTADLMGFAEIERQGFEAAQKYANSQLGEYQATVRMFENGHLTRVVGDSVGVWVTVDAMSMERFEELSSALRPVLVEYHNGEE